MFKKYSGLLLLALIVVAIPITVYLTGRFQTAEQHAAGSATTPESGFNTHLSAAGNGLLDITDFKADVDDLVANHQTWIRFNILDGEIATTGGANGAPTIIWDNQNLSVYD